MYYERVSYVMLSNRLVYSALTETRGVITHSPTILLFPLNEQLQVDIFVSSASCRLDGLASFQIHPISA